MHHHYRDLEMESSFLSTQQENPIARARLTNFLNTVMTDLNKNKVCKLTDGTISLYLKVIELRKDPPTVKDWDVPVLTKPYRKIPHEKWDLTTQKYSNIYAPTTKIHQLYANRPLQDQCINCIKIKGEEKPIWGDVFRFLCRFNHCNTVKQVCCIVNPATLRFNERKLIQWACLEGFLQRVHKYPVSVCEGTSQSWNGTHCMDEICLALNMSYGKLNDKFEHDPTVSMICK
uniref:Nitrogen permease regulator 2-like protein n=1 Tax=Cacopsylla melanoneura TaxID=428564 RepID=A0A8D8PX45_9HEMI